MRNAYDYRHKENKSELANKEVSQIKEWLISNREKAIVTGLCIWSFLHTYIIIRNMSGFVSFYENSTGLKFLLINGQPERINPVEYFYPITKIGDNYISYFNLNLYDYTEYFVYVGGAWMIYFLYRYLKGCK